MSRANPSSSRSGKGKGKAVSSSRAPIDPPSPAQFQNWEADQQQQIEDNLGPGFENPFETETPAAGAEEDVPHPTSPRSESAHQSTSQRRRGGGGAPPRPPAALRSDIFSTHFQKVPTDIENTFQVLCNYCPQVYKFKKGGGYGTFVKHMENKHPSHWGISSSQTQIRGGGTTSSGSGGGEVGAPTLFKYTVKHARRELAMFICAKHLPFGFGDDELYEDFQRNAYNPAATRISRRSITREVDALVIEFKQELISMFAHLPHKVSICSDVWSDHWNTHFLYGSNLSLD